MITKNWYKMIATLILGKKGVSWSADILNTDGVSKPHYFNTSNSYFYDTYSFEQMLSTIKTSYTDGLGVCFGTGNTPATLDDYKLSGDIITTLSGPCAISRGIDADGAYITARYTLNNNGNSSVTVSEIAALTYIWTTNSSNRAYPMIDRTVLDTPVTIPAGGVGQVVYTITFNYPTATT